MMRKIKTTQRSVDTWTQFDSKKKGTPLTDRIIKKQRFPLYQLSVAAMRITVRALKWIVLFILLYLTIGLTILLTQNGMGSIRDIVVYGIMGFVTFFMGYCGWMLARDVISVVQGWRMHNKNPDL